MAVSKRKRKTKVSKGIHGQRHYPLTELEKVLAGKGQLQALEPTEVKVSYGRWYDALCRRFEQAAIARGDA